MSELVSIHMSESSILDNLGKHQSDSLAAGNFSNQVHDEMLIQEKGDIDDGEHTERVGTMDLTHRELLNDTGAIDFGYGHDTEAQ